MQLTNSSYVFDILENGVFIEYSGPFFVAGLKNGLAALAFESKKFGRIYVDENSEAFQSRGVQPDCCEFSRISDNHEFMLRCAKHGLCGILLVTNDGVMAFEFCERLGYPSPNLPIAMRYVHHGVASIQTRFLVHEEEIGGRFIPWRRFDILDYATAGFAVTSPFSDWTSQQPFFELRPTNGSQLSVVNPWCIGDWSSLEGHVPFFSSIEQAELFIEAFKRGDETAIRFFNLGQSEFDDIVEIVNGAEVGLSCYTIPDLRRRIDEIGPSFGTVINPSGTRDNTGYTMRGSDEYCILRGVSGNWRIDSDNELVQLQEADRKKYWNEKDTFFWNGINDFRLQDLTRSFSSEAVGHRFSDVKVAEISEFTEHLLAGSEYQNLDPWHLPTDEEFPSQKAFLDGYLLSSWDVFTGEHSYLIFDSIFSLIQFIWCFETQDDFPLRLRGASNVCGTPIGIRGSNNTEREKKSQESTRCVLAEAIAMVVQNGYNPSVGGTLSALINRSFKTMHAELIGHVKDVMWQLGEKEAEKLCEKLSVPFSWFKPMFENEYMNVDPRGEKEAVDLMGEQTWQQLDSKSKHFVASGLGKLQEFGVAPQLDYSLISIAFVKAVEVELWTLFRCFSRDNNLAGLMAPPCQQEDRCEYEIFKLSSCIFGFTEDAPGKGLTLGEMGNLLQRSKREQSQMRKLLGQYFEENLSRSYLTSNSFAKKFINTATRKYRNGGAHDSRISMETAHECKRVILGSEGNPGVLAKMFSVD